jgi:hypothetical protein
VRERLDAVGNVLEPWTPKRYARQCSSSKLKTSRPLSAVFSLLRQSGPRRLAADIIRTDIPRPFFPCQQTSVRNSVSICAPARRQSTPP